MVAGAVLVAALAVAAAGHLGAKLLRRPQRGVLALALLAPFDGLLVLIDDPGPIVAWKEALVAATVAATFLCPPDSRRRRLRPGDDALPSWLGPVLGLVALAAVTLLWTPAGFAIVGAKVDFFYLLLPLALWRCPFDERDRDQLVSILMAGGVLTAIVGIGQQVIGPRRLNELGYEWDTVIRTTNSVLRSFSTFALPFPFAFYVVLVLAVCVPVALADPTRTRNQVFLLATPILAAGLATAIVRAAVVAVVAAGAYLVARRYREVLAVGPVAILIVAALPAFVWAAALSASSLTDRLDGWGVVVDAVTENPLGTGIGTTSAAAEAAVDAGASGGPTFGLPPDRQPYQPDNYYVKRLLELGPLGLWLTVTFFRHVLSSARAAHRRAVSRADRALIDGFSASVVGALAAATVATYWEIFPLDLYFWMMLGVVTSTPSAESSSAPSPSAPEAAASRPTFATS